MTTRMRRASLYAGSVLALAAITWVDYLTGYELGFFVFYTIPIALAAWYVSRRAGLLFAFASAGCWYLADRLTLHPYSKDLLIYWETFIRLVSFVMTAETLSQIRSDLRRRERFLGVVSHDLRAPLGALATEAAALRTEVDPGTVVSARVDAIIRAASRADALIEDLLDLAKLESRELRLHLEQVDVRALLHEVVGRIEPGRVRLILAERGELHARADVNRLERIVLGLLAHALERTPPGGAPVELGAEASAAWVTVRVVDHGPAIPHGDLAGIFDRFYRGPGTEARSSPGIDPYLVRLLVEAHGGMVWAETDGEGGGVAVSALLPVSTATQSVRAA